MLRPRPLRWPLALLAFAAPRAVAAQEPPPAPSPAAPPPAAPLPPGPPVIPPGVAPLPGYASPAYPSPPPAYAYPPGYGAYPQYGYIPPREPPEKPATCCRWSFRYDPFDLIVRRLTFQAEVAVAGPFAIEIVPSWIFGSPFGGVAGQGVSVATNATFYLSGQAFHGLWIKAHVAYENYSATFTNPLASDLVGQPTRLSSAILGALFGSTIVFGRDHGFALSAGVGVGAATAGKATLTAPGDPTRGIPGASTTLYDGFDKVRILGTVGLGVAF
jgi:hypothetical protein